MPKDKIEDTASDGWYAEVSWRRKPDGDDRGSAEGHVQLATVNLHSPFEFPDIDTGDHFEAGERFDGWRVTLDEEGIDRLIKALHKAKRQAFGGSETVVNQVVHCCGANGVAAQAIADAVGRDALTVRRLR